MILSDDDKEKLMDARNDLSDWINSHAAYLAYEGMTTQLERINTVLNQFDTVIGKWERTT